MTTKRKNFDSHDSCAQRVNEWQKEVGQVHLKYIAPEMVHRRNDAKPLS